MPGTLFLVATPIGNLEDVTARAVRILREVDLVAAEDTRRTGRLLQHLGITKPLRSYFDAVERERAPALVRELLAGKDIALVSDAGTCSPAKRRSVNSAQRSAGRIEMRKRTTSVVGFHARCKVPGGTMTT